MNWLYKIIQRLFVTTEPLPDYGDLIPWEEFQEDVKNGYLIDYDGYGRLATKTKASDMYITPSIAKEIKPGIFTHVLWFNR